MCHIPEDLQDIIYRYIHYFQYWEVMNEFNDCVKWCVRNIPQQSRDAFCLNISERKNRPHHYYEVFKFLPNNFLYII